MASGGNEAFDKNAAVKKNFFRKFGRRMGNVFTRKRMSRGELDDIPAPQAHTGMPSGDGSGVVINPLMAADIPSASVYQSSRTYPINVGPEIRSKGGGGGVVTGSRLSGDFPTVSSAMSEESVATAGPPPERCLSEGNLVDSSSPRQDQLGGLGGRIWRAVPSSMESLPKSLQTELQNKMNSRAQSISEDEGLPHSPSDTLIHDEKMGKRGRTTSHEDPSPQDRLSASLTAQTPLLSQSSRSLMSCDDSSDGESYGGNLLDLDFNALRRAESLDNTAAKHKIQVSRPRKSRSSSNMVGGLRKHKSMSTVQLSGISEEVSSPTSSTKDESGRPRTAGDKVVSAKTGKLSSAASELAQELAQLQNKQRTKTKESEERKFNETVNSEKTEESSVLKTKGKREVAKKPDSSEMRAKIASSLDKGRGSSSQSPSTTIPVIRPTRPVTSSPGPALSQTSTPTGETAASKVTRLRSMFGTTVTSSADSADTDAKTTPSVGGSISFSASQSAKPRPPPARSATSTEPKNTKRFFSATPDAESKQTDRIPAQTPTQAGVGKSASVNPPPPSTSVNLKFSKSYGVSGPPSSAPARTTDGTSGDSSKLSNNTPTGMKPKVAAVRQMSSSDNKFPSGDVSGSKPSSTTTKRFAFGEKSDSAASSGGSASHFTVPSTKAPIPNATDKSIVSKKANIQLREKKAVLDTNRSVGKSNDEAGGRPVSKVMDLVRNFQRLQETTTG